MEEKFARGRRSDHNRILPDRAKENDCHSIGFPLISECALLLQQNRQSKRIMIIYYKKG